MMNLLNLLAAGAPAHLNPVKLFLDADIVVQLVMVGLLLASVWIWTIIVSFSVRIGGVRRKSRAYEDGLWQAKDMEAFHEATGPDGSPTVGINLRCLEGVDVDKLSPRAWDGRSK